MAGMNKTQAYHPIDMARLSEPEAMDGRRPREQSERPEGDCPDGSHER